MKSKKGFTFIETIVVVGVIGFVLPALFAIMFGLLREQAKIYALREVKKEGDLVLNNMETNIKSNADGVYNGLPVSDPTNEICTTDGSSVNNLTGIYFRDSDGNYFHYYLNGNTISIEGTSSQVQTQTSPGLSLTTSKVVIPNFSLSCNRTSTASPPIISVAFDVSFNNGGSVRSEDNASLHYQTKIKLNNY